MSHAFCSRWSLGLSLLIGVVAAHAQTKEDDAFISLHRDLAGTFERTGRMAVEAEDEDGGLEPFKSALGLLEKARERAEKTYGPNHLVTSDLLSYLGDVYITARFIDKGEPLVQRAIVIRQKNKLDADHIALSDNWHDLARCSHIRRDYPKAEEYYREAIRIREKNKNNYLLAESLSGLARLYRTTSRPNLAEPMFLRAVKAREEEEDVKLADALVDLAEFYIKSGQFTQAAPLLNRAQVIVEKKKGKDSLKAALVLHDQAWLATQQGKFDIAETAAAESLAIRKKYLNEKHHRIVDSLGMLGDVHTKQSKLREAAAEYGQAIKIAEERQGADSLDLSVALNGLANVKQIVGEYAAADALFLRALKICDTVHGVDHPDSAVILGNRARLFTVKGDYPQAEALFRRAAEIILKKLGPDHPSLSEVHNNLAVTYFQTGQYARAQPFYENALRIQRKTLGNEHPSVATTLANLGLLASLGNSRDEAGKLFRQSLEMQERTLGKDDPAVAISLSSLGAHCNTLAQYGDAEKHLRRAVEIMTAKLGPDYPRLALPLNNLGVTYLFTNRPQEAEKVFAQAIRVAGKVGGPDYMAAARNLGQVRSQLGRWKEAEDSFDLAAREMRRYVKSALPVQSEPEQLLFLSTHFQLGQEGTLSFGLLRGDESAARSAAWVVNGKGIRHEALAERTLAARDCTDPKLKALIEELTFLRRRAADLAFQDNGDAAGRIRSELQKVTAREQELARLISQSGGHERRSEPWVEVGEVRSAIPKNSVLIDIVRFRVHHLLAQAEEKFFQPERYVAWILPAEGAGDVRVIDLGPAEAIDSLIAAARVEFEGAAKAIQEQGEKGAEEKLRAKLDGLSKLLLQPLLPVIEKTERWIISPDASLWLIPWAALPLDDGYAVEKHPLSFVVCGRDLVAPGSKTGANPALIFADPDYGLNADEAAAVARNLPKSADETLTRSAGGSFELPLVERLPATAIEARIIEEPLKSYAASAVQIYEGKNALEGVFKVIHSPRVLVLSTHGFFLSDQKTAPTVTAASAPPIQNPLLRCGLLFAGCNERNKRPPSAPADLDDGVLTGLEIVAADLKGTDLVVLSACETGLGNVETGEGVAGLRQAFQLAGARAVVASLWQVPDRETAKLMGSFFTGVAEGAPKAEALRQAQLKLIAARREKNDAAHPFYWAAFTLTGSADFIPVKEPPPKLTAEQLVARGIDYEKQGDSKLALQEFKAATAADPNHYLAWFGSGIHAAKLGATDDAIAAYTEAIRIRPKAPVPYLQRSDLFRGKKEFEKALADAEQAVTLNPKEARGYSVRGQAYVELKQTDKALADYTKALEIDDKYRFALSNRAYLYAGLKQYDQEIADLVALHKLIPNDGSPLNRLGLAYEAQKNIDKAIEQYREAIRVEPKYHFPYGNLGFALEKKGELDQALEAYTAGIQVFPKYVFAFNRRGLVKQKQGKHAEAVADFDEAHKFNPKSTEVLANRAVSKQRLKQLPAAIEDLSAAIALDAKYAWAVSRRGQLQAELGAFDKAEADAQRAVELDPTDNFYRSQRALFYLQKGDLAGYRAFCQATLDKLGDTTKPDVANSLAWICAVVPDAVADLTKPVKLGELAGGAEPKQYAHIGTQGAILFRAGKFEDAIKTLESSVALEGKGGMTEDHLFLAMARHKAGHADDARRALETATKWIDQKIADGDKATDFGWSRKLELSTLRKEAEALLGK